MVRNPIIFVHPFIPSLLRESRRIYSLSLEGEE